METVASLSFYRKNIDQSSDEVLYAWFSHRDDQNMFIFGL